MTKQQIKKRSETETQKLVISEDNGKYGFIDKTGKEIIPLVYDEARYFNKDGKAKVKLNDETFFIDENGNIIE
ncbi:MAG: WG repeat-containing protein [Bacteroidales bacterium]|jgi:hypothetical protein|nr:WG repeat-containing protein [Bacteroidales bacterium]